MPPPAARAMSATMADTMLPAAPVATTTESGPRARVGSGGGAVRSSRPMPSRTVPRRPTSTTPASRSVSVDECAGHLARVGVGRDVEHLDHGGGTLPGQGLGEAAHGTGHGAERARLVVAVGAAVAGGADEERSRLAEAVVHRTGRGREQLDPHLQAGAPLFDVEVGDRPFVVERGKGVETLDGSGRQPRVDLRGDRVGVGRRVEAEHLDATIGERRRQAPRPPRRCRAGSRLASRSPA